jgi:hypothetical protein
MKVVPIKNQLQFVLRDSLETKLRFCERFFFWPGTDMAHCADSGLFRPLQRPLRWEFLLVSYLCLHSMR